MATEKEAEAARAGRGGVAVLGAKVFFVLSGLVQQTLLPQAIGLAGYGALALVSAPINMLNSVVIASTVQGVSRSVASSLGHEREAFRPLFRVHVILAVVVAAAFAALAPLYGAFENAPHIVGPVMLVALVALAYGVYSPLIGLLNGRGEFVRQAGLDTAFALGRTIALVGVGWLFVRRGASGAMGSTLGWVLAAIAIVPIAARVALPLRVEAKTPPPAQVPVATYLAQLAPLALAQLFSSAVMGFDLILLGHFLSTSAPDSQAAAEWVGVYKACQLFAFLPYQLLLSITQVLFPMLARAKAEGDPARVRLYVERGTRLAIIACGMMVSVLVAIPSSVLRFLYSQEIADRGGPALRVLALGQGAFTMLAIAATILSSLGRERIAALITFCAVVAVGVACWVLAGGAAFGQPQLVLTATGTTLGIGLALVAAGQQVRATTGGFIPAVTVGRVALALVVAGTVGSFLPRTGHLLTPFVSIAIAVAYLTVLAASRELTRGDVHALRALRG
jgi:stage V sporulation protein B